MVTVGSSYWNVGIGRERGDVESDAEGMRTMHRWAKTRPGSWSASKTSDGVSELAGLLLGVLRQGM